MKAGGATVVVKVITDAESIVDDWEGLADRVGTVFSSRPGFVRHVAGSSGFPCEYVSVRRGGRLVALAPLMIERRGPVALAKVVGTDLGVPLELLSEDDEASDALSSALASRGYMLSADSMIAGGSMLERLCGHSAWTVDARVRERVLVVDLPPGSDARSIRSKKTLQGLRADRRRAARESSFRYEVITDVDHLDGRWPDIVALAADAVEGTGKVNYLVSPHGGFARAFLRAEACAGRLCVVGLVVGEQWTAHAICLLTGDRAEGWLTHYDVGVARVQPGHQIIEWLVDNHDELGFTQLDQGIGVNEIKSTWAKSGGYDVVKVLAVPSSWVLASWWIHALRAYPAVESRLREAALGPSTRLLDRLSRGLSHVR